MIYWILYFSQQQSSLSLKYVLNLPTILYMIFYYYCELKLLQALKREHKSKGLAHLAKLIF